MAIILGKMPDHIRDHLGYDDLLSIIDVYGDMNGFGSDTKPLDSLDRELIAQARAAAELQPSQT